MDAEHRPQTAETCPRCGATMEWRHGTWQCARCRFRGCCEGLTGDYRERVAT